MTSIASSVAGARSEKDLPRYSNSVARCPMPTPRMRRPPDSRCRGGGLLGYQDGVSERQDDDRGAQAEIRNDVHQRRERDQRFDLLTDHDATSLLSVGEERVVGPDALVSEFRGRLRRSHDRGVHRLGSVVLSQ
jgi:hypothetical protein